MNSISNISAQRRRLAIIGVACLTAISFGRYVAACEDEEVTSVQVGKWTISSSEKVGEEDATSRKFPHFKLGHLMDNNARTPWVFRGKGQASFFAPSWGKRHALSFYRDKKVEIDEIRIMNGYNKRADLFWRNDRVVQLGIGIDGKKLKIANLSDKMGWHKVSIPRQKVDDIVLEFVGVRKGRGADNDICVSEIQFYNRGKRVKP